jgi:methylenetetrahydrofolate--tRNA-(uracil-5-)-methyltransferase
LESIDPAVTWRQSRCDKAGPGGTGADYINCPMTKAEYEAFLDALLAAEKTSFKEWEASTPYFDGCLPIEVMAERGRETLRFGPMKPVGLTNPHRPGERPYAVVQLRQDNALGTLWNMVGFQTKLKPGAQTASESRASRAGSGSAACTGTLPQRPQSCSTRIAPARST